MAAAPTASLAPDGIDPTPPPAQWTLTQRNPAQFREHGLRERRNSAAAAAKERAGGEAGDASVQLTLTQMAASEEGIPSYGIREAASEEGEGEDEADDGALSPWGDDEVSSSDEDNGMLPMVPARPKRKRPEDARGRTMAE
jgi:hypothetical protein